MMLKDYAKEDLKLEKLFVLILASIQFSHIVDFVVLMPLGPVFMRDFSIGPLQFGSLVSSYNMSAAITGVLYGLIADRFGRKIILIWNFLGFILGTVLCSFANSFESLLLGRIIAGGFGGTLTAVVFAMVSDLIPFQRRGKAMSTIMSSFSLASILGVPLGLWIAEQYTWRETFIFIALISFISLISSIAVFPVLKDHVHESNALEIIKRLFRLFLKRSYLKTYGLILLNVFSIFSIIPYLSPYAVKNIGVHEYQLKYMYLVGGIFTILSARIIGKLTDKYNPNLIFIALAILSVVPMFLYTNATQMTFPLFLVMSTIFMILVSGRMIPIMTMASEIPGNKDRGTFMGLLNSVRSFGSALATLYAGFIISQEGEKLVGFNRVGVSSILITIIIIPVASHVYKVMLEVKSEKNS